MNFSHIIHHQIKQFLLLQTLQTTTVAAQASVPRRDMAVVTAVRNVSSIFVLGGGVCCDEAHAAFQFVRLLGGTLASAIGSTIMRVFLIMT